MGYVGNQQTEGYSQVPAKQDLTGATGTSLTLTHAVASAEGIDLFINNVRQEPTTAYSVGADGVTVTLTGSVVATDDIYVVYNSLARQTSTHPSNQALQATSGAFSGNVAMGGTLSVTGASTATGGLNVGTIKDATGTTTAMTIDSNGLTTIKPVVPAFSVYRNGDQAITSGVYTKMQLNAENFDTDNFFDSTTNYRFQPTIAGYYQINGAFYPVSSSSANYVWSMIYKNGALEVWGTSAGPASLQDGVSQVNALIEMNGSTDYLELYVFATGASPVIKGTASAVGKNFMSGFLVRAT